MTDTNNPYAAPITNPALDESQFTDVIVFSVSGRMGRVRYIVNSIGFYILVAFLSGLIDSLTGVAAGTIIGMVVLAVLAIMLTIQRCHDFNTTGWLSMLIFVPIVNFMFWLIPGTDSVNNYGNQTPPNSTFSIVVACILLFILFLGIFGVI